MALNACASLIQRGEAHAAAWQAGWAACAKSIASLITEQHDDPRAPKEVIHG